MVFAMDSWYTYTIIIGARNQHTASGAYEFHIHGRMLTGVYIVSHGQTAFFSAGRYHLQYKRPTYTIDYIRLY